MLKVFSFFCLLLSIYFFTLSGYWIVQRYNPFALAFSEAPTVQASENSKALRAISLSIPSIGVNLPIFTENINKDRWPLRSDGLVHLGSTPEPGLKGNSVIYGHNWKNILGSLVLVKPGQKIEVLYSDGSKKTFEVKFTQTITPDQTQILKETKDTRITLYTCTGFLDTKRFVVTAVASGS